MVKSILTIFLGAIVFWGGISKAWPVDMEDRFLDNSAATKNIFIDVKDATLSNVLKIISKESNLSFVASQDVADKKISLYLNKVPLNQALQMILDANGLMYEMQQDSNVFVVKAKYATEKHLITRVYQLKYATVSSSKLNSTISITSGSASGSSSEGTGSSSGTLSGTSFTGGSEGSSTPGAPGSSGSSGASKGGLEDEIKNALSPDGKVVEDTRTNSLIITDLPAQFEAIENTIAKLDVPIPQVLIEVEMLDVSKSTADQMGITYGANLMSFEGGSASSNWPFYHGTGVSAGSSSSSTTTSSSTSTPTTGWNANGMTAVLSFLTTKTDARTLARPRLLTLNNQTAQIQISTDQAIDVLPSSSSTGTAGSTQGFTVDRYTTGVILKVTPQANLTTREITMAVSPKVVDVILSQVQPPAGSIGSIFDPETRGSDSILNLKDGQTMVIGGLMTTETDKTTTKLPILGDIPVLGAAFRSKNTSKKERELIIFLTPHIIDNTDQLAIKNPESAGSFDQGNPLRSHDINNSLNDYETKNF